VPFLLISWIFIEEHILMLGIRQDIKKLLLCICHRGALEFEHSQVSHMCVGTVCLVL
jgi:hypothetical protein